MDMKKLALMSAIGLGLLAACEADGGHDDGAGDEGDDGFCDPIPWSLDEPVPGEGYTPQEALDAAGGWRQGTLTWHGNGAEVQVEPASGETELSLQVRYTGGDVELCDDADAMAGGLSIEVTLDFATSDGAFADSWSVTGDAHAEGMWLCFSLDEVGIEGTFSAEPDTDDPDYWAETSLEAEVTAESNTGVINVSSRYERPSEDPEGGWEDGGSAPFATATWTATPTEG
jgi:hypothetical protein